MNWDQVEGNWKQFKGKVKEQWGKLTDDHLDIISGKREVLAGKIQEAYGTSKEEAENQIRKFEARYGDWMPDDMPPPPVEDLRGRQPPRYKSSTDASRAGFWKARARTQRRPIPEINSVPPVRGPPSPRTVFWADALHPPSFLAREQQGSRCSLPGREPGSRVRGGFVYATRPGTKHAGFGPALARALPLTIARSSAFHRKRRGSAALSAGPLARCAPMRASGCR